MQNFNSAIAITNGLKSRPIERLKKTWNVYNRILNFVTISCLRAKLDQKLRFSLLTSNLLDFQS